MKLPNGFRNSLKMITAIFGISSCLLIGAYFYAITPDPNPAAYILGKCIPFIIGTTVMGGFAFLTEGI